MAIERIEITLDTPSTSNEVIHKKYRMALVLTEVLKGRMDEIFFFVVPSKIAKNRRNPAFASNVRATRCGIGSLAGSVKDILVRMNLPDDK